MQWMAGGGVYVGGLWQGQCHKPRKASSLYGQTDWSATARLICTLPKSMQVGWHVKEINVRCSWRATSNTQPTQGPERQPNGLSMPGRHPYLQLFAWRSLQYHQHHEDVIAMSDMQVSTSASGKDSDVRSSWYLPITQTGRHLMSFISACPTIDMVLMALATMTYEKEVTVALTCLSRNCERRRPHTISLSDLQAVYHLPISGAARTFDIGLTLLKKRCRELGLKRWPYRKLKSMDKLLQSIKSVHRDDPQV